jgi:hypothetical protein
MADSSLNATSGVYTYPSKGEARIRDIASDILRNISLWVYSKV